MDEQVFRALLEEFYLECKERLAHIEEALVAAGSASVAERAALLVDARRELHTLKGNSGMMGLGELQQLAHRIEDRVGEWRPETLAGEQLRAALGEVDRFRRVLEKACGHAGAPGTRRARPRARRARAERTGARRMEQGSQTHESHVQESVRVSFAALDSLVDLISEMVIFRNRLAESLAHGLATLPKGERQQPLWREVEEAHETLDRTLDDVQAGIMRLRMVPLGSLFAQLKRIVFDESAARGKRVELETSGGETPLDKALLEVASEAMGHLVRNAVVHGMEAPEARAAARQAGHRDLGGGRRDQGRGGGDRHHRRRRRHRPRRPAARRPAGAATTCTRASTCRRCCRCRGSPPASRPTAAPAAAWA